MIDFRRSMDNLTQGHRDALRWFDERTGKEISWPPPMPDGTHLVNRPKGIHKPSGWRHALSIRETFSSPYGDRDPVRRGDGGWTYDYFQEGAKPEERDNYFTNRALMACRRDGVPVAVLRQTRTRPNARYLVLGLALVRDWQDGYFRLESLPPDWKPSA